MCVRKFIIYCIIAVIVMVSISQVVFGFDNYPEDIKNHWAKAAIVSLEENKIIDSLDNALYYPDNPITKNEFLSMLKKAAPGKHSQGAFGDEYITGIRQANYFHTLLVMQKQKIQAVLRIISKLNMNKRQYSVKIWD